MKDAVLRGLGYAAAELAKRGKDEISIRLTDGRSLAALYDPLFRTISVNGATFPEKERNLWVRLCYGCDIASILQGGKVWQR